MGASQVELQAIKKDLNTSLPCHFVRVPSFTSSLFKPKWKEGYGAHLINCSINTDAALSNGIRAYIFFEACELTALTVELHNELVYLNIMMRTWPYIVLIIILFVSLFWVPTLLCALRQFYINYHFITRRRSFRLEIYKIAQDMNEYKVQP